MTPSRKYTLDKHDLAAITRGALLAGGGAAATYLATTVLPNLDQSTMLGALVAGIGSIVINVVRKYLAGE